MYSPKYLELLNDSVYKIFKELLNSSTKSFNTEQIEHGNLNPLIDYNPLISKMMSYCDDSIEELLKGDSEKAKKILEKAFFDGKLYDYVIQSGLYDKLAEQFNEPKLPISYIGKGQKIIIDDDRSVKESTIPLEKITKYYIKVDPKK